MKLNEAVKDRIISTIIVSVIACAITVWVNQKLFDFRLSANETATAKLEATHEKDVAQLEEKYDQGIAEIGVRLRSIEHSIIELATILKERNR